ncbi:hypothetical protein [Clostridioides sp. ES-S-0190-01]|uniref:hypothetical protein n=1 Tax=Clostridioides sp. ES-S-0190-01 TaxID=2770787 RepID=UPI001D105918|nr:hypothetical protein [Clostridioides sp. ES-S-0190-01]
MGYDYNECKRRLEQKKLKACLEMHCMDFSTSKAYHDSCGDQGIYQAVHVVMCRNSKTGETLPSSTEHLIDDCIAKRMENKDWNLEDCCCCCSCFADGTFIAIPDGEVEVQNIKNGDEVLGGSIKKAGEKINLAWEPVKVQFSTGTESGEQPSMVYIVYRSLDEESSDELEKKIKNGKSELIVTADHVFLLANGKFTVAGKLKPGDMLIDKDGNEVPVLTASLGHYTGGVHHITTDINFEGSADKHLVIAGGVVCGDYTLQLHFEDLEDNLKVENYNELPIIGSEEHMKACKHLVKERGVLLFHKEDNTEVAINKKFSPYKFGYKGTITSAHTLFTREQANDIFQNGTQFPIHMTLGLNAIQYLIKLFKGFYPDINIHLEWDRIEPNVYAFEEYGVKTVLVSGGLVRMENLDVEGLAMAIGHGIGRFYGGVPQNSDKMSGTGPSDYYSFGVVSRKIWFGDQWMTLTLRGYEQLGDLCRLISDENATGNEYNVCEEPSIKCRLSAMASGIQGGSLPVCAGGVEKPKLKLEAVDNNNDGISLTFNMTLDKVLAEDGLNYLIDPVVQVEDIIVDSKRDFIVNIKAKFESGKEYTISVKNLKSIYKTDLDSKYSSIVYICKE